MEKKGEYELDLEGAADGDVIGSEEKQYASLGDLCEAGRFVDKFYPDLGRGGAWVRYNTFIAMDVMLAVQAKYQMMSGTASKRNSRGFIMDMLKRVLVKPAIRTDEDARLLLKANSRVLLDILGEVLGKDDEAFKTAVEDISGESPGQ